MSGVEAVAGGASGDILRGNGAGNRLTGGEGSDRLAGGEGNDTLDGGLGRDALRGGPGADVLDPADGGADDVACGTGIDSVGTVIPGAIDDALPDEVTGPDAKDELARDCERVRFEGLLVNVTPRSVVSGGASFDNPCGRWRCRGEVALRYGSPVRLAGRRSFDERASRVVVPLAPAARRRLALGGPTRVSLRWSLNIPKYEETFRTAYRTTIAVPPAPAHP